MLFLKENYGARPPVYKSSISAPHVTILDVQFVILIPPILSSPASEILLEQFLTRHDVRQDIALPTSPKSESH